MAEREIRLLIRKKEATGNILPVNALIGEPFVNTYEGRMFFSGTSGGTYEPVEGQPNVFEVGSNVAYLKALSGINLNNLFIATGSTGQIITYEGVSNMSGMFLSGTTNGLTLAPIADIIGTQDITRVQPGTNITTGGTEHNPIVNLVDSPFVNNFTASGNTSLNVLSANTIFSGSTDLGDIFELAGAGDKTRVQGGTNITTGGTANTPIINLNDDIDVTSISADTMYSGSTDLYNIFQSKGSDANKTFVQNGTNTFTGGTADAPTVNITGGTFNELSLSNLTQGRVVYVGTGGKIIDEAGFEYNDSSNTFLAENIKTAGAGNLFVGTGGAVIGSGGDINTPGTGDLIVHGNLVIYGEAVSAHTSELYIEDNRIELNYNPSGDTTTKSLGAGWSIQDGTGIHGSEVFLDIRGTDTGVDNRSFTTNLNDLRIRESGTVNNPNGVRVLAEQDILNGGTF